MHQPIYFNLGLQKKAIEPNLNIKAAITQKTVPLFEYFKSGNYIIVFSVITLVAIKA